MDAFLAIPEEKQRRIIEVGYRCFGRLGYKKASAQDIAEQAGISKGMIFHYFGSKKGMYLYLIQHSYEEIIASFQTDFDPAVTDFFDRILMMTECKIQCLSKHPSLLAFFESLHSETDSEVAEEVHELRRQTENLRADVLLSQQDLNKFKDPSYGELSWKLLIRYGQGYANSISEQGLEPLEVWLEEFQRCVAMMKENLYRPEYLK